MSTVLPLRQQPKKKVKLPKRSVITIIKFTKKSMTGLILISIILGALQPRNTPKLHKTFSTISIKLEKPPKRLLISNFAQNVTDSLLIVICMEYVLTARPLTVKEINVMPVENLWMLSK